jgi:hypothetical protein
VKALREYQDALELVLESHPESMRKHKLIIGTSRMNTATNSLIDKIEIEESHGFSLLEIMNYIVAGSFILFMTYQILKPLITLPL